MTTKEGKIHITKNKKHRADGGFREFSAFNKSLPGGQEINSDSPTFFIQPLCAIEIKEYESNFSIYNCRDCKT